MGNYFNNELNIKVIDRLGILLAPGKQEVLIVEPCDITKQYTKLHIATLKCMYFLLALQPTQDKV